MLAKQKINSLARLNSIYNKNHIILNKTTFERLFNELYSDLCRYSIQFVLVPQIAEDIVQNVFIYVWEKRNEIDIHTSYSSYLYKAVKNKSIDYLRSKFGRIDFIQEDATYNLIEYSNPQKKLEEGELESYITKVIRDLPQKCSIIFSMSRFGDLPNKQIATQLNISVKTVEAQITIAIKKIKAAMSKYKFAF